MSSAVIIFAVLATIIAVSHAGSISTFLGAVTSSKTDCPDKTQCETESTCCPMGEGKFGCCSYKNAVCCSDGINCCPEDTFCHSGDCISKVTEPKGALKLTGPSLNQQNVSPVSSDPSLSVSELASTKAQIVICPDRSRSCPDLNTCCLMPNHQWVCCPLPLASCCPDGYHCCPYGSRCDPTSTRCYRGNEEDSSSLFFLQSILSQGQEKKQL